MGKSTVGDYTIPGNSGTPVFNKSGEVIGIIAQAWKKVSLKRSKTQQLVNRAFTIMPLSELLEPLKLAVIQKAIQKKMSKKQD